MVAQKEKYKRRLKRWNWKSIYKETKWDWNVECGGEYKRNVGKDNKGY